jgi:hypothetical protein
MEMIRKAMKLRILKRFGAVGLAAVLALTVMLISQLGFSATAAQSEESESHAKGLQGAWRVQLTVRDCQTGVALRTFPALFTFAKGGTLSVTTAGQLPALSTTGLGVWRHTDGHAYSAVSEAFVFSNAGVWTQTHRLTRAIEIGNNEDEFTDTVTLQIFDTNGNAIVTGCATSVGSRFE